MNGHSGFNPECVLKPVFKKADYVQFFNAFLDTIDWDIVYVDSQSAEEYWCDSGCDFKGIVNIAIYNTLFLFLKCG